MKPAARKAFTASSTRSAAMTTPTSAVYLQKLVHDLLEAFGISQTNFDALVMRDIGIFSKIIQDVESVYVSVDSAKRFQEIFRLRYFY